MLDYLGFIRSESELFNRAAAAIDDSNQALGSVTVPSCEGWSGADLIWHLAEVQYFWACIVEGNLTSYTQVVPLERPADDRLQALQAEQAARLERLLAAKDPEESCWSWHPDGHTVGWVLRRQAHEVLIHRIDAELTAIHAGVERFDDGAGLSPVDEDLATDGVDEILTVMLDIGTLPDGRRFEPSGRSIRLEAPQRSWTMALGRVLGTDDDGNAIDLEAIDLSGAAGDVTAQVTASAAALNLWLWRRTPLTDGAVSGAASAVDELYELAKIE